MKNLAQRGSITVFVSLLIVSIGIVGLIGYYLKTNKSENTSKTNNVYQSPTQVPNNSYQESSTAATELKYKSYTSKDLKISFKYPANWYINEKDFDLMLTTFVTRFGRNDQPTKDQLKIFINNFIGCFEKIEENLIDPACGEGGSKVKKNEIISKEMKTVKGGTFYKYLVKTPSATLTYYLLENKDRVLQISKQPDPSNFEKEFDEIIESIEFIF